MKKIKVLIKNEYELELQEDGQKGDLIDLKNNLIMDLNEIKQNIYNEKLKNLKIKLEEENKKQIQLLTQQYENQIKDLHHKNEISLLKKKQQLDFIQRERSNYNTKLIGENLEKWCDNEIQNQLLIADDISWYKDNEEINKTKGDFIYKLYYDKQHNKEQILTSALLEMKTEIKTNTPNNNNKQKNERYFAKLDKDRNNKNLEFALLVSELEYEQENDIPIKKVKTYPNMFIIRPPYLVFFLNVITCLGRKNKEIIIDLKKQKITFYKEEEIKNTFLEMKNEILDNSFKNIEKNLQFITKENQKIKTISEELLKTYNNIEEKMEKILKTHLKIAINKVRNFKIDKILKEIKKY
ncbi:hypothetical protein LFWB_2690 [Candidatus Phytoplasma luffae]|uniref:DUF2130 domain-containing protein n=1 Tax=Loofah witches'-broom phytoplasma TaxID=35773 RepID=A0A975IM82_LOWBP|nr:DUF2130 domain-containing protein [Candidatus Phytoplasma luffae]QTX02839.1 hypothetical protein LFWB_2690 [Candidatus Phytoplasma luffae]